MFVHERNVLIGAEKGWSVYNSGLEMSAQLYVKRKYKSQRVIVLVNTIIRLLISSKAKIIKITPIVFAERKSVPNRKKIE
jgi:hypothetical protein